MKDNEDKELEEKSESWEKEELKNVKVPPWLLEYIKSQQKPDENISDTIVRLLGVIPSIDRCLAFASEEVRKRAKEIKKKIEEIIKNYRIKFKKSEKENTEAYIYVAAETNHPIAALICSNEFFKVAYRNKNDEWDSRKFGEISEKISDGDYKYKYDLIAKHVEGAFRRWGIKENQWERIE